MTAEGVLLLFGIFALLLLGWSLAGMCSLNELGSPPRSESSVARALSPPGGVRATETEEDPALAGKGRADA